MMNRRSFIRAASSAVAGLAAYPAFPGEGVPPLKVPACLTRAFYLSPATDKWMELFWSEAEQHPAGLEVAGQAYDRETWELGNYCLFMFTPHGVTVDPSSRTDRHAVISSWFDWAEQFEGGQGPARCTNVELFRALKVFEEKHRAKDSPQDPGAAEVALGEWFEAFTKERQALPDLITWFKTS